VKNHFKRKRLNHIINGRHTNVQSLVSESFRQLTLGKINKMIAHSNEQLFTIGSDPNNILDNKFGLTTEWITTTGIAHTTTMTGATTTTTCAGGMAAGTATIMTTGTTVRMHGWPTICCFRRLLLLQLHKQCLQWCRYRLLCSFECRWRGLRRIMRLPPYLVWGILFHVL